MLKMLQVEWDLITELGVLLNAGIGYGGSCFPKDTHALVQIAGGVEHDFTLLKSVIDVNNNQQSLMVEKLNID